MHAIVLAATHERKRNAAGRSVPQPLLDLDNEPLLTILVKRISLVPDLERICIVTNEAIKPELDEWLAHVSANRVPVHIVSDGTVRPEERKGAVGDLTFGIRACGIHDDLLVVGGDNWFTYDISEFVKQAVRRSPTVLVTPFGPGWRSERFGVVELDESNRILQFLEKPQSTILDLKASCIYSFAASDLEWLDEFAKEHSTVCAPGTFFQWLVERADVYGVEMPAAWYDVESPPSPVLKGPDFLKFRDVLRGFANPQLATWERAAAQQLQWASSYVDLLDVLVDPDPNRRIVAADLLGRIGEFLIEEAKERVISELCHLLGDPAINQIAVDALQADEDSASYVSATAAEALVRLGYAEGVVKAFERARREGFKVEETHNKSC